MDVVTSPAAEKQPVVCKSQCDGEDATDYNGAVSSDKTDTTRSLNHDKDAVSTKEKAKVKPAFYFPDGSILKALLMSPLSFKNKIRNGIYQNGAYSTFPPESKVTSFVDVKSEPFDYDDHSNSISPTVLEKKFKSRKRVVDGVAATASMKKVNSFINKFGSELVSSSSASCRPENEEEPYPAHLAGVTHLVKEEVDIDVKDEADSRDPPTATYSDDSDECIPSLNVEVELEEGEGIINSHNIDYFYSGTNFGKDLNNGEVHESSKQIGSDKLGLSLEDLRCVVCGRQFNFKKNMNKHLRHMHGLGRFRCAVCPLEFEKRRDLIHHRDSHSESGEAGGGFKCEICGKIIQWYNHFVQHRRTHELGAVTLSEERRKRHTCTVCDKAFRSAANLRVHSRTHTGERPFLCNVCGVSFAQKRIQVDHMNKHTGARPYECPDCGESFSNYITYNVHKRTRHSRATAATFACATCGASFVWRSNLVSHMRSHATRRGRRGGGGGGGGEGGERHACKVCARTFAAKSAMVRHERSRHGGKGGALDGGDRIRRSGDETCT